MSHDKLFQRWRDRYSPAERDRFFVDGIVDEDVWNRQRYKVLFVTAEPNGRGGTIAAKCGNDLRRLFRESRSGAAFGKNLACWTKRLLDDERWTPRDATDIAEQLGRVALINLKKTAGGGEADFSSLSILAWMDRDLIAEQIALIAPDLIVSCGKAHVRRLFWRIMHADPFTDVSSEAQWSWAGVPVLPAYHPSTRPAHQEAANACLEGQIRSSGFRNTPCVFPESR